MAFGAKLFAPALCYCLITFGYHPAVHVKFFHRLGDYSYGLYIFGWPLQQLLVNHIRGALNLFAVSYALTLIAAICSWHLIEKPCLALKDNVKDRFGAMKREAHRAETEYIPVQIGSENALRSE